jgi:hypothetical protein
MSAGYSRNGITIENLGSQQMHRHTTAHTDFDKIFFFRDQDKGGARGRVDDQSISDWTSNNSSAKNSLFESARTETTSKGRTAA